MARLTARSLGRHRIGHGGRGAASALQSAAVAQLPATAAADSALAGHRLKFLAAAAQPASFLPETPGVAEVCLAGRSNVGKSSLLNALTISAPARAADKPGLTRTVNFYGLGPALRVVDLPGYGFAFAKSEDQAAWNATLHSYLSTRRSLRRILLLLDGRHGLKQSDREFMTFLEAEAACRYQLVFTKCDLVPRDELARRWDLVHQELAERWPRCMPEVRPK